MSDQNNQIKQQSKDQRNEIYRELLQTRKLTDRQKNILNSIIRNNSFKESSEELGITVETIRKTVSRIKKFAELNTHINNFKVPSGYSVKGTSTLIDSDGDVKSQWIKIDKDQETKLESLKIAVQEIVADVNEIYKPIDRLNLSDNLLEDQISVYTIGDAHIGMYTWDKETGDDFNLEIAEYNLLSIMDRLIESTPATETALIVDVGDFFHSDNQSNETSNSKNKLDVDTRWAKVLKVGLNIMVKLIEKTLLKHDKVIVRNAIGNHNEHSAIFISLFLESYFRNEQRVQIEQSPATFWYFQFGKNLIGVTHGNKIKLNDLGEIMAADCQDIWSSTKFRYWYTGHIHHDVVKELRTCKVESFRTIAPKDAWHTSMGYRSGQDMKSIILHKDFGEIQRITCNIDMIKSK